MSKKPTQSENCPSTIIGLNKDEIYKFSPDEKRLMPAKVAAVIESLMKHGSMLPILEEIYEIIREEIPDYKHGDNSNARKMLTAKILVKQGKTKKIYIRRLIPLSAYVRVLDKLGIASGKYLPGRQAEIFTTIMSTPVDKVNKTKRRLK